MHFYAFYIVQASCIEGRPQTFFMGGVEAEKCRSAIFMPTIK